MNTYDLRVTECRWGWTATVVVSDWGRELLSPPVYWRPTRAWVIRRGLRTCRYRNQRAERQAQSEIVQEQTP